MDDAQAQDDPKVKCTISKATTNRSKCQKCKEQIMMHIDCELAYMNTNHEDFIGFAK